MKKKQNIVDTDQIQNLKNKFIYAVKNERFLDTEDGVNKEAVHGTYKFIDALAWVAVSVLSDVLVGDKIDSKACEFHSANWDKIQSDGLQMPTPIDFQSELGS